MYSIKIFKCKKNFKIIIKKFKKLKFLHCLFPNMTAKICV